MTDLHCRPKLGRAGKAADKSTATEVVSKYLVLKDKVVKQIKSHHTKLADVAPALSDFVNPSIPTEDIHDANVYLPSSFSGQQRKDLGLESLGDIEGRLRVSVAHEILGKLRTMLGMKGLLVRLQQDTREGIKKFTREQTRIGEVTDKVKRLAEAYRKNYKALLALDVKLTKYAKYGLLRELKDDDLVMLRQWTEVDREVPGKAQKAPRPAVGKDRPIPWFWRVVGGGHVIPTTLDTAEQEASADANPDAPAAELNEAEEASIAKEIRDYNYKGTLVLVTCISTRPDESMCSNCSGSC